MAAGSEAALEAFRTTAVVAAASTTTTRGVPVSLTLTISPVVLPVADQVVWAVASVAVPVSGVALAVAWAAA